MGRLTCLVVVQGRGTKKQQGHKGLFPPFPCGRACINQHLMNNKDCFFCKATIVSVDDWEKATNASATSSAT